MNKAISFMERNWPYALIGISILILGFMIIRNNVYKNMDYEKNPVETNEFESYNYESNEYRIIEMDKVTLLYDYYADFLNLLYNNPELAWQHLTTLEQEKYKDYNEFYKYLNNNYKTKRLKNSEVKAYRVVNDSKYLIENTNDDHMVITENAIWDYYVEYR